MELYQYTIKGDPATLLSTWSRIAERIGKEEFFLDLVVEQADGITVLDACPSEDDFQGWIDGDDWRAAKAELGDDVEVTRVGTVRLAIARHGLVEVVPAHVHAG